VRVAIGEAHARILASANRQIFQAGRGEEALSICRAERPDLVLLDSVRPGIQGLDICKRIKGDPELSRSSRIPRKAHSIDTTAKARPCR
jgi:DNA-binding response OmpR family regulator